MNRRSRAGCIDCRRSKVKCDEIRPACGTCGRRGRVCQGYSRVYTHKHHEAKATSSLQSDIKKRKEISPFWYGNTDSTGLLRSASDDHNAFSSSPSNSTTSLPSGPRSSELTLRGLPLIPPGIISPADESTIEIYFNRHPVEMVIGAEFVHEMNANVLVILQHNPEAISDSLSGIGQIYLSKGQSNSILPILTRRARILANLRTMQDSGYDLEQLVVLLLGLSAMELIDVTTPPGENTIPAVIANTASLISHHVRAGREISSLARYFIRALARQDMIISLTQMRRPLIPTSVWLDDECRNSADRLMGFTGTLMPLLGELSSLAEDMRGTTKCHFIDNSDSPVSADQLSLVQLDPLKRAADLRAQIESWHPNSATGASFRYSRKLVAQAKAYRSAALLYLYRLFNPPQSSPEADHVALGMAHEVLVYTSGPREELRMLLWPVFIAACEALDVEDRKIVLEVFDSICLYRKTATALRTKNFCIDRVWKARDAGMEWDWLKLVELYPGECLPI